MNNRRRLVIALGTAASIPVAVLAQSKKPLVVIGWLDPGAKKENASLIAAFREAMAALGWREHEHYLIEERWAEGRTDHIQALAQELAGKMPAISVTRSVSATTALSKAAPNLPIVMASGGDLIATGLAASLARPGGMVTGLTALTTELMGKRVELLMEAVPNIRTVGLISNPDGPAFPRTRSEVQRALARYSAKLVVALVRRPTEFDAAMASLNSDGVQALIVPPSTWFSSYRKQIIGSAARYGWPIMGPSGLYADAGALVSYGTEPKSGYRRAAYFVDRILKGTKPGDLPIEQPVTYELVVNLKTAKALGLTMPPEIMLRATRVIQ